MKIRNGFVSNSSSRSFIINKDKLNDFQINLIKDHVNVVKNFMKDIYCEERDKWYIIENEYSIEGNTIMDNFDMNQFLNYIGIKDEDIEWNQY